jgi:membrane-bound metal-dependent hydrolase YbcI (DUF457 family)
MIHSVLFSAVFAALLAALFKNAGNAQWKLVLIFFLAGASHGLLDALTDGGLGVAFFSPFIAERYFFPWTPIPMSPIGMTAFFIQSRGAGVVEGGGLGLDAYIDPFRCNLRDTQAQRDLGLAILAIHRAKVGASEVNAENGLGRRQGDRRGKGDGGRCAGLVRELSKSPEINAFAKR